MNLNLNRDTINEAIDAKYESDYVKVRQVIEDLFPDDGEPKISYVFVWGKIDCNNVLLLGEEDVAKKLKQFKISSLMDLYKVHALYTSKGIVDIQPIE